MPASGKSSRRHLALVLRVASIAAMIAGAIAWPVFMFLRPDFGSGPVVGSLALAAAGAITLLRLSASGGWMPRRKQGPERQDLADQFLILLGVFFTFMPMGLIGMMVPTNPGNWFAIVLISGFAGVCSMGWASAFVLRRYWILLIVVPVQYLVPRYVFNWLGNQGYFGTGTGLSLLQTKLTMAVVAIGSLIIGYITVILLARRHEQRGAKAKAELDVAVEIHRSLVPAIDTTAGSIEVLARSRASDTMGGDLVDVIVRGPGAPGDARLEVDAILADVSGHGVGAGIVMGMLKSSARTLLRRRPSVESLLGDVNVVLSDLTRSDMFATMVFVRVEGDGSIEYGLAGHLPIMHHRAASGRLDDHPNDALPLGVDPGETFVAGCDTLAPGDTLVVITDGLTEVQNAAGRELGLAAMREVVRANAARPLRELYDAIIAAASRHGPQIDDQSVLLIRRRAVG
jgi:serine phosphatase RsbU (regulator of sigma subunit)